LFISGVFILQIYIQEGICTNIR